MASMKKTGSGLMGKLILGIFVPIVLAFIIIGAMLFINIDVGGLQFTSIRSLGSGSLQDLGVSVMTESTDSLNSLGEQIIGQKARDIAKQVEIYTKARPGGVLAASLNRPGLGEIAIQKVGQTGYTMVIDDLGTIRLHPDPAVIGQDLHKSQAGEVGWIVDMAVKSNKGEGYYSWKETDGRVREKYMAIAPIGGGFHIAATAYMDEFSKPAQAISTRISDMQKNYLTQYNRRFLLFAAVVGVVLALLLVAIYVYSRSVVKPIRDLCDIADKISMGDLNAVVNVKGTGEVALLAQSIERMQTSVRAAIERLQKRRESAGMAREAQGG
jgi:HAMP domain-containing protein